MIQDSMNLQSYNRYAYVMNNPLLYTDPSGYLRVFGIKITPKVIVAAVVSYYTAGAVNSWMMGNALAAGPVTAAGYTASTITAGIASGAAAGFTSSMVMTNGDVGASLRSAASGAIGGGVSAYYGSNYSIERVASNTFAGGVQSVIRGGSFSDGARSSFTNFAFAYLNVQMRSSMIEQSKNALNGEMLNDGTGLSRGLFGDGFKLAGGRWDPFLSKDEVQCSLLGCLQSGAGKIFGIPYSKGGFVDMVTESFAGPHDKANSRWFYRLDGYIREGTNSNLALDLATNYTTSLAFALPFAAGAIYEQTNAASFVAVPK